MLQKMIMGSSGGGTPSTEKYDLVRAVISDSNKSITVPADTDFLIVHQYYTDIYSLDKSVSNMEVGIIRSVGDSVTLNKTCKNGGTLSDCQTTVTWTSQTAASMVRSNNYNAAYIYACKNKA